jgi:hypothetical protein
MFTAQLEYSFLGIIIKGSNNYVIVLTNKSLLTFVV